MHLAKLPSFSLLSTFPFVCSNSGTHHSTLSVTLPFSPFRSHLLATNPVLPVVTQAQASQLSKQLLAVSHTVRCHSESCDKHNLSHKHWQKTLNLILTQKTTKKGNQRRKNQSVEH